MANVHKQTDSTHWKLCDSDIAKKGPIRTEVKSQPDANVTYATSAMANDNVHYRQVIVCVGTNDCTSETMEVDSPVEHFIDLVDVAMEKVASPGDVVITSVLPRTDFVVQSSRWPAK